MSISKYQYICKGWVYHIKYDNVWHIKWVHNICCVCKSSFNVEYQCIRLFEGIQCLYKIMIYSCYGYVKLWKIFINLFTEKGYIFECELVYHVCWKGIFSIPIYTYKKIYVYMVYNVCNFVKWWLHNNNLSRIIAFLSVNKSLSVFSLDNCTFVALFFTPQANKITTWTETCNHEV